MGLFGFDTGSQFAREIEQILQQDCSLNKEKILQFETILNALYQELSTDNNPSQQISLKLQSDYPLVLIVDNDSQFSAALTQEARSKGIRTAIVSTPELARSWLDDNQNQQVPDAVVIKLTFAKSIYNPQILLDSLTLIAEFSLLTPSVPVIVIADSDRLQDRIQVARHGGYFYLQQPVTSSQIIRFCQQVLERCWKDKKIMVIDDDIELLQTLPSLLQPWKFHITTLDDPRQFWEVIAAVDPNLLVLDIEMPYISGIELCKVLRNHPYWRKLPILFLSIHTDIEIREQVFTSGADDFVNKPVAGKQLADRILKCLERRA